MDVSRVRALERESRLTHTSFAGSYPIVRARWRKAQSESQRQPTSRRELRKRPEPVVSGTRAK